MVVIHVVYEHFDGDADENGSGEGDKYHFSFLLCSFIYRYRIKEKESDKTDRWGMGENIDLSVGFADTFPTVYTEVLSGKAAKNF